MSWFLFFVGALLFGFMAIGSASSRRDDYERRENEYDYDHYDSGGDCE